MPGVPPAFYSLDDIIVAPADDGPGAQRPVETEAFLSLTRRLAKEPARTPQRLVELAMALTGAGSAGLSVEEEDAQGKLLRWVATTGELTRYVNGTMPRDFSPCGTAMDQRRPLIMREPVRYYAYISQLHLPVSSVILVPFTHRDHVVGTLWVVSHTPGHRFTSRDLRVVQDLATFAAALIDVVAPAS